MLGLVIFMHFEHIHLIHSFMIYFALFEFLDGFRNWYVVTHLVYCTNFFYGNGKEYGWSNDVRSCFWNSVKQESPSDFLCNICLILDREQHRQVPWTSIPYLYVYKDSIDMWQSCLCCSWFGIGHAFPRISPGDSEVTINSI